METIDKFYGEYRFLSNFHPCSIEWKGNVWPASENIYQAEKTDDVEAKERIRMMSPGKAKREGLKVNLRTDWDSISYDTMLRVVRAKFIQNKDLREKLIATGDSKLVEGNDWHDNAWGDCVCPSCTSIEGKNWLGIILMKVREELRT